MTLLSILRNFEIEIQNLGDYHPAKKIVCFHFNFLQQIDLTTSQIPVNLLNIVFALDYKLGRFFHLASWFDLQIIGDGSLGDGCLAFWFTLN